MEAFNIDKHPLLDFCSDMKEIVKPLGDCFGITNFSYLKLFSDNSRIDLSSRPQWMKHFYNQRFYFLNGVASDWKSAFVPFPENVINNYNEIFLHAEQYFNITNYAMLVKEETNYTEIYFFATTRDNPKIINFYLHHQDLLEKFALYFKEKASGLIKAAEKHKIILTEQKKISHPKFHCYQLDKKTKQTYLSSLGFNATDYPYNLLTSREKECAAYVSQGKSAKEIGRILDISYRTVEKHIDQLKYKLDCSSVSKLIVKLLKVCNEEY